MQNVLKANYKYDFIYYIMFSKPNKGKFMRKVIKENGHIELEVDSPDEDNIEDITNEIILFLCQMLQQHAHSGTAPRLNKLLR